MPIIRKSEAPRFSLAGLKVTGLASPQRGARETCLWRIVLAPGSPGVPHSVTREETFLVLSGQGVVTLAGQEHHLGPGDALVVPPLTEFSLANPSPEPLEAVVAFPVGGQAVTGEGAFTPPWAE
jgi:quercetin dioxygenase-like cupin family protein